MNKNGFTLAEVLITLAVIGVVAALSIPGLIADSQEKEFAIGLKKAYAELSQAVMTIQATEGFINTGSASSTAEGLKNQFANVMNFIKTDTCYNLWKHANYKFYKGGNSNWPASSDTYPAALLSNGMLLRFYENNNCTQFGVNACSIIGVDINGEKAPNMWGKDNFVFYIAVKNNAYVILPAGVTGDSSFGLPAGCTAGSTTTTTSLGCTAKLLSDPDHMP